VEITDSAVVDSASTRQLLLESAQREISEHGYSRVSLRSVARDAAVDPSLIRHYFGSRQNLLDEAVEAEGSIGPLAARVLHGAPAAVGVRAVRALLEWWETQRTSATSLARLSASLTNADVARTVQDDLVSTFFMRIAEQVSADHQALRAELAAGQMLALAFARHLVGEPVLAAADREELVRIVGRTVQRLLTEPLATEVVGGRRR